MNSLEENWIPLSERIRPVTFDDVVGQPHLTGKNGILKKTVEANRIFSMIFYGPPGTGKTTMGRLIGEGLSDKYEIVYFSASLQGTGDLKKIFERGTQLRKYGKQLVVFVDEIHRLNKSQQDVLLPVTENGTIILIGATTENPSFEINPALMSRCRLIVLRQLNQNDIKDLLKRALEKDPVLSSSPLKVEEEVLDIICENSGGDARISLNLLDTLCDSAIALEKEILDFELLNELSMLPVGRYTKKGEEHYDLISAFIKSMRGSDPDAALYYMMRMIEAGEDPKFITRRMVILASEDIGIADPMALLIANAAFDAVDRIGLPECSLNMAEAVVYLSAAPKSNAVYKARNMAQKTAKKYINLGVPLKLRNPVTDMMKKMNYGKEYVYPHNTGGFHRTSYLPDEISSEIFYNPTEFGREKLVKERLKQLWKDLKKYQG